MPTDPRMREEEEAAPIEVSRSAPSMLLMARSPRLETSANIEAINTDGHKDDARDDDAADDDTDVERGILKQTKETHWSRLLKVGDSHRA